VRLDWNDLERCGGCDRQDIVGFRHAASDLLALWRVGAAPRHLWIWFLGSGDLPAILYSILRLGRPLSDRRNRLVGVLVSG
jgi:hypothetical protein